ncbi:MAG: PTS sugar transporter subunit IIA [Verrucomicrobiota bacterium]
MELTDILGPRQIIPELAATNRWGAIDELIAVLAATGKIQPGQVASITEAVKWRERSLTTGIGYGIGTPTGTSDLIEEAVMALGRSVEGVEFDALDDRPVHIVFLSIVPKGKHQKYLHTTAKAAKLLGHIPFREAVKKAPDAPAIYEAICEEWKQVETAFKRGDNLWLRVGRA